MNVNTGALIGGILGVITLALFVRNYEGTTKIINSLSQATTSFASTVIGSGNGSGVPNLVGGK